ncbi:MAG: glycosyl transferase, partial [Chloroflexota bacterium]|nr:glycosyl transferase [Chloroflexota bacterium]
QYVCHRMVAPEWAAAPTQPGYVVLYIDQIQRNDEPVATAALLGKVQPLHVVRIHGIDYAYVYRVSPPPAQPMSVPLGNVVTFSGYDLDAAGLRSQGVLTATLHWQAREPSPTRYMLFVHVLDAQGRNVGQVDLPLVGPLAPSRVWQVGQTVTWRQPIPVPGPLAAGRYWLSLGVYDARTGERLPVDAQPDARAPGDGENALIVGPLMIP